MLVAHGRTGTFRKRKPEEQPTTEQATDAGTVPGETSCCLPITPTRAME